MNKTLGTIAALALTQASLAQHAWFPRTPPVPAPQPAPSEAQPAPNPPTLDDLLGLAPDKQPPANKPPALDPSKAELERQLSPREAADQFKQAVELMGQTADRLQTSRDTGLATQRIQDDILRKLDMIIQSAEQQQQQQQSGRSRSSQSQPQDDPSSQPDQQQGPRQESPQSSESTAMEPPQRRDGPLGPDAAARSAAWGNLPDRAREALMQSGSDTFSRAYRLRTEAYYRKLAEEGSR